MTIKSEIMVKNDTKIFVFVNSVQKDILDFILESCIYMFILTQNFKKFSFKPLELHKDIKTLR